MSFLKRRKQKSFLQETYENISVKKRLLYASLFLLLVGGVALRFTPEIFPQVLAISVGSLGAIHFTLAYPNTIKTSLALLGNVVLITLSAMFASATVSSIDTIWVLVTWVAVQACASALYVALAFRHPRHKIWFTLTLAFLAMFASGLGLIVLTMNPDLSIILSPLGGLLVIFARIIFPRSKAPQVSNENDVELQGKLLEKLNSSGFAATVKKVKDDSIIVVTDKKGHILTLDTAVISSPFTYDKAQGVYYEGSPVAGWFASSLDATRSSLPKRVPFSHIIVVKGDPSIDKFKYKPLSLTPINGGAPKYIGLVSSKDVVSGVKSALQDMRPTAASKDQITKLAVDLTGKS